MFDHQGCMVIIWEGSSGESNAPPGRQQTLGEMTLEEFLFRAGVVCSQQTGQFNRNNNNGAAGGLGFDFGFDFADQNQNNISFNGTK